MDESLIDSIQKCAMENYPKEMVGIVTQGVFTELTNVSNNPTQQYSLSPKDKVMIFEIGDDLEALVHSHPSMNCNPSEADLVAQRGCGFPFWIIGTDGRFCTEIKVVTDE